MQLLLFENVRLAEACSHEETLGSLGVERGDRGKGASVCNLRSRISDAHWTVEARAEMCENGTTNACVFRTKRVGDAGDDFANCGGDTPTAGDNGSLEE